MKFFLYSQYTQSVPSHDTAALTVHSFTFLCIQRFMVLFTFFPTSPHTTFICKLSSSTQIHRSFINHQSTLDFLLICFNLLRHSYIGGINMKQTFMFSSCKLSQSSTVCIFSLILSLPKTQLFTNKYEANLNIQYA